MAIQEAVSESIRYLSSDEALRCLDRDPYWPKWDSPWWHMTLLWEMGLAAEIPERAAVRMADALESQYRRRFPGEDGARRDGLYAYRDVSWCQCSLGTMCQVLEACGIAVDQALPWARPWFLRHQLPDGGLNCDEKAYAGPHPKSSIVSTLPPLEALLARAAGGLSPEEAAFLDRGARYLVVHRLFRSADGGRIINQEWLKPCFPRFYDYDILRGLSFLGRWAQARRKPFPMEAAHEAADVLREKFPDGRVVVERLAWQGAKTLALGSDGQWTRGHPAADFNLLRRAATLGEISPELSRDWREVDEALRRTP